MKNLIIAFILSGILLKHVENKTVCFLLHFIFKTRPTAKPYSGTIFLCYMQPKSVDLSNIKRLVEKRDCMY